jgi:hypothetical protein
MLKLDGYCNSAVNENQLTILFLKESRREFVFAHKYRCRKIRPMLDARRRATGGAIRVSHLHKHPTIPRPDAEPIDRFSRRVFVSILVIFGDIVRNHPQVIPPRVIYPEDKRPENPEVEFQILPPLFRSGGFEAELIDIEQITHSTVNELEAGRVQRVVGVHSNSYLIHYLISFLCPFIHSISKSPEFVKDFLIKVS